MTPMTTGWDGLLRLDDEHRDRRGRLVRVVTVTERDHSRRMSDVVPVIVVTRVYVQHGKPIPRWINRPKTELERATVVARWSRTGTMWVPVQATPVMLDQHARVLHRSRRGTRARRRR